MSISEALQSGGYTKEVSTAGEAPIYEGVYKAVLTEVGEESESQFGGTQIYVAHKISEVLAGRESRVGGGDQPAGTAWISRSMVTLSPINAPSRPRGALKAIPKSERLI